MTWSVPEKPSNGAGAAAAVVAAVDSILAILKKMVIKDLRGDTSKKFTVSKKQKGFPPINYLDLTAVARESVLKQV